MRTESQGIPDSLGPDSSTVKKLCDSFTSELQSRGSSSIESWLEKVPPTERLDLFRELLSAEVRFKRQNGNEPSADDYLGRFPDFAAIVLSTLESLTTKEQTGSIDRSLDSTVAYDTPAGLSSKLPLNWKCGDVVGRYRLDQFLGRGGFGEVWRAHDPELVRDVAIKLPRLDMLGRPGRTAELRDEARRAASLRQDGIVPVYDIGQFGGGTFIVSELIEGPTLLEKMKAGPLSLEETVRIIRHLALSLHQAHVEGLVHRDIKPSNILIRPNGTPAITDFGLALSEEEQLAASAGVAGTLLYMSPEQARGQGGQVDCRTDLYSLGVVFYQMLTGRLPFKHRSSDELLEQIAHREVRPPRSIVDTIPAELERICLRCLSIDVQQRYSIGKDIADDLQRWEATRAEKPQRRKWPVWAAVAALCLSLGGIGSYFAASNKGTTGPDQHGLLAVVPRGGKFKLSGPPLKAVANYRADNTDFWQPDAAKNTFSMRAERNLWLFTGEQQGAPPLRISGSVLLDDWVGTVGFAWGVPQAEDQAAGPSADFYALLIKRYDPPQPLKLSLERLTICEIIHDIPAIGHSMPLAVIDMDVTKDPFRKLEVFVDATGVEVSVDGNVVWKYTQADHNHFEIRFQDIVEAQGAVGLLGRGKAVVFKDVVGEFHKP